jgi:hypothetical protein
VSAASGSFPLPATYFPDFKNLNDPHLTQDFLQQLQDNFEALKLQVGSNADTSAPQPRAPRASRRTTRRRPGSW